MLESIWKQIIINHTGKKSKVIGKEGWTEIEGILNCEPNWETNNMLIC